MIEKIINAVTDIVKALLPRSDLSTMSWAIRISLLALLCVGIYIGIKGTPLGDRLGLNPVEELPKLTHVEIANSFQQSYEQISQLRESDPNVRATFLMALVDNSTNNIVLSDDIPESKTRLIFWAWSLPVDKYAYLDVFDKSFNQIKKEFLKINEGYCLSGEIKKEIAEQLKRGVYDFQSTHFSVCPVFTTSKKRLVAAAIAFYKQPSNYQLYFYEDRLQRATNAIKTLFYSFSNKYEVYFD